jgi:hypothetical protein
LHYSELISISAAHQQFTFNIKNFVFVRANSCQSTLVCQSIKRTVHTFILMNRCFNICLLMSLLSVISGFTSASAIIILCSQLQSLFGIPSLHTTSYFYETIYEICMHITEVHFTLFSVDLLINAAQPMDTHTRFKQYLCNHDTQVSLSSLTYLFTYSLLFSKVTVLINMHIF